MLWIKFKDSDKAMIICRSAWNRCFSNRSGTESSLETCCPQSTPRRKKREGSEEVVQWLRCLFCNWPTYSFSNLQHQMWYTPSSPRVYYWVQNQESSYAPTECGPKETGKNETRISTFFVCLGTIPGLLPGFAPRQDLAGPGEVGVHMKYWGSSLCWLYTMQVPYPLYYHSSPPTLKVLRSQVVGGKSSETSQNASWNK